MKVGIWLYKGNEIGWIEHEMENGHPILRTMLYYPPMQYHPSRSYWDENEYVPTNLPDMVCRGHTKNISSRIMWSRKWKGYFYYELGDGSEAYTTQLRMVNNFYYTMAYRNWTLEDSVFVNTYTELVELSSWENFLDCLDGFFICAIVPLTIVTWFIIMVFGLYYRYTGKLMFIN